VHILGNSKKISEEEKGVLKRAEEIKISY